MKKTLITSIVVSCLSISACSDEKNTTSQVEQTITPIIANKTLQPTSTAKLSTCLFPTKSNIPDYSSKMTVQEKKQRFKDIVLPAVDKVFCDLSKTYSDIEIAISSGDTSAYDDLKKIYKVTTDQDLLMAVKPHPKSIAMAQAAMESAWATSRFTREANNLFGVWSFNKNEPRIAAGEKRGAKTIWLKKYSSVEDSVRDYYKTLARSSAFSEFRELKMITDDPYILVTKLDRYSEKKAAYGVELTSMIKFNKYFKFDK